jgi:hypothetical protein
VADSDFFVKKSTGYALAQYLYLTFMYGKYGGMY